MPFGGAKIARYLFWKELTNSQYLMTIQRCQKKQLSNFHTKQL